MALIARHAARPSVALPLPRLHRPRVGVRGLGIASGAIFVLLLVDAMINPRAFFDLRVMMTIQELEFSGLRGFVDNVNLLTSSTGAIAAWGILLLLFVGIRWWLPALGLLTMPAGGIINEAIGILLVERTRPHLAELARGSGNFEERSFPSGHVVGAVMLYGFLFVVARRVQNRILRTAIQASSLGLIAVVGFSRVWDGAHWPTDVLGAYALGGLLLAVIVGLYGKIDAAVGDLPFIHAAYLPHDETRPHAHALTSLVIFDGDRVSKVYAPGFLPRAIYWLAFQAPFPYVRNRAALEAAMHRRNLAALLTESWYGSSRVARATGIDQIDGHLALTGELVDGHASTDRKAAKAFLTDLRGRFEEAGLPTWQIDPRQPRAVDNVLETSDGTYKVVDLESGLVAPIASLKTWSRGLKRGLFPLYDDVYFDITRAYVEREAATLRATLGDARVAELTATLDAAEAATRAWHAGEPRLWGKLVRGIQTGFGIKTWRAKLAGGQEKATQWIDRTIAVWEAEERITAKEAATLRAQMEEPTFQAMLPYLGAHILVSIPLRFPFGSIARSAMVLGALATATGRLLARRIDRETWKVAWSIHSPLVTVLAAIPGFGTFAYLAAKPVRANRLLLRVTLDAALYKVPWHLYERSGFRRWVARPRQSERFEQRASEGPLWEFGWVTPGRTSQAQRLAPITPVLAKPDEPQVALPAA